MHDIPYAHTDKVGPEITASMAVICHQIKKLFTAGPVGVQILAGANKQALAVAKAAGVVCFMTVHVCFLFGSETWTSL